MLTPIGTKCKIITEPYNYNIHGRDSGHSGHEFPLGTIVIINGHDGHCKLANMSAEYEDGHDYWYINENDIEVVQCSCWRQTGEPKCSDCPTRNVQ